MTQSFTNRDLFNPDVLYDLIPFVWQRQYIKSVVLNFVFRNISFTTEREKIRVLTSSDYRRIQDVVGFPVSLIHRVVSKFLVDLVRIREFLRTKESQLGLKNSQRRIKVYLHKMYRLAPVFDYKRARLNAKILKRKLDLLCFWPRVTTQVAIIIYATDLFDNNAISSLLQGNLRVLCSCSAYAFHRTRNRLKLNP
jgi:hypothetical protein